MSGIFNPPRALQVPFNPAGNIVSTNVQTMGEELDSEKVAKSGDTMTGPLVIDQTGLGLTLSTAVSAFEVSGDIDDFCFVGFLCVANNGRSPLFTGAMSRYSGSNTSPLLVNDIIMRFTGVGAFDGSNVLTGTRAEMRFTATENWNSVNQGTDIRFFTKQNSGGVLGEKFRIANDGALVVNGNSITITDINGNHVFRRYTVGTVPSAASYPGRGVMVTPTSGNERLYTSNGTNWYDGAGVILS